MRGLQMPTILTIIAISALTGLLFAAETGDKPATRPAGDAAKPTTQPSTQPTSQPAKPEVVIETNMGDIVLQLDADRTPATVQNFLKYVDEGFYKDTIFHRVIKDFMIQGGGFNTDRSLKKPTHPPVVNESRKGASNTRGTIAMARTQNPNSATCQFFINHGNRNTFLDTAGGGYTAFGHVIDGMDVVDKIADVAVRVGPNQAPQDPPSEPVENVVIKSIHRK